MALTFTAILLAVAGTSLLAIWGCSLAVRKFASVQRIPGGNAEASWFWRLIRDAVLRNNRRLLRGGYQRRVRQWLIQAGEPRNLGPEELLALQQIGAILGAIAGWVIAAGLGMTRLMSIPAAVFGAAYPLLWLRGQVKRRQVLMVRALPFNLDLLTLSVEAGLDFGGALAKVVEKGKPGPLREEFELALRQLKLGKTREEALKDMARRVDLTALNKFVTAVVLADRMGTSLGKVLRTQATQLRLERTQRAEKLASQAPVKMLLPLVLCIFPTVFMVLFGPIVFALIFGSAGE